MDGYELALEIANVSDMGRVRPHNEDSTATDPKRGIAIVADGMGGYEAGEAASAVAVTSLVRDLYRDLKRPRLYDRIQETGQRKVSQLLVRATENAHRRIRRAAAHNPKCKGMGTTIVAALFHPHGFSVAHVGDSRMYRLRGDEFLLITKDHSLYQDLIDRGLCSPEEALEYANKSLITRALGLERKVQVDVVERGTAPGDIYLLCSDGLNDMVADRAIHLTLRRHEDDLERAAEELIELANGHGGKDNISVVLVRTGAGCLMPDEDVTIRVGTEDSGEDGVGEKQAQ